MKTADTAADVKVTAPEHVEDVDEHEVDPKAAHDVTGTYTPGLAIIEQMNAIPTTGQRVPTTKLEYFLFMLVYFQNNGSPIGSQAGPLRQKLLAMAYPDSNKEPLIPWGGTHMYLNSFILDSSGILFAVTLVLMLVIGPYADYGVWRPYILMTGTLICCAITFGMIGTYKASQWEAANGLWIVGTLGLNVSVAFYQATFPSIARNLPQVIKSEQDVRAGIRTPEEHDALDQFERSKLYNLCNILGSALVIVFYAIAVGISYAVTHNSIEDGPVIKAYRVLLAYFGVLTLLCTVPYFIFGKKRPGQAVPADTPLWLVGPKQVWSAMRSVVHLRHALLYLIGYAVLGEASGTAGNITSTLQNNVIHFNPIENSAFGLLADLGGGLGTVFIYLMQKKFRFSIKSLTRYGACQVLVPIIWGAIGTWTTKFGFHNTWEFWAIQLWNFQTAAWGSYSITMISEVVPAPKMYLFFALFATVSRTSGFTGPFICSAINERANGNTNVAYWFCVGLGILGVFIIFLVDPKKAKMETAKYLEREAQEFYTDEQRAQQEQYRENEAAAVQASEVARKEAA